MKLIKRFCILQEWLKTSDIWRDYQIWNKSFLKLFQKFKSFDVSRRANAKKISTLSVSERKSVCCLLLVYLFF
jgi:hydrogenase maturation factor